MTPDSYADEVKEDEKKKLERTGRVYTYSVKGGISSTKSGSTQNT
jgi:hypothetical protein